MTFTRLVIGLTLLLGIAASARNLLVPVGATVTLEGAAAYGTVTVAGTLVLRGQAALHARAVTVRRGGVITQDGPVRTAEAASHIDITCADSLTVAAGGCITANGKGFAGGEGHARNDDAASAGCGPGAGGYPAIWGASAGGSHGGRGGAPSAKDPYDSPENPALAGSGGGGGKGIGGAGGGVIRLAASLLRIDGAVTADGADATGYSWSGGGAGGSVVLTARALAGDGLVTANGGSGTIYAGGGGGGRIAVSASGKLEVHFSTAGGGNGLGVPGTEAPKHFGEMGTVWFAVAPIGRVIPHSARVLAPGAKETPMSQDESLAYWMPWRVNPPIVTVAKELYRKAPREAAAPIVTRWYVGPKLEMMEFLGVEARDDVWTEAGLRWSADNGRTWSALEPRPDSVRMVKGIEVWEGFVATEYDPTADVLVGMWLRQIQTGNIWNGGLCNCYTYARLSHDQGRTWSEPRQLTYEAGAPFDPAEPLKPEFLLHNQGYPGSNILRHANGTLIHCVCLANTPDDPENDTRTWKQGSLCFIGKWDATKRDYVWTAGQRVSITPDQSSRGLLEPDLAELKDGRVLVVWRGSNTATTPGRKWYSISTDGGKTLSPVREWRYDDGTQFYSPSSIHYFIRHSNGTLYWLGNICPNPPSGNSPRFPLVIAEVNEQSGALKRDTVTVVDDRREDEGFDLQLSNFAPFENRETCNIELYLTNYGHQPGSEHWLNADSYHYVLTITKKK